MLLDGRARAPTRSPACATAAATCACRTIDGCLPCHGGQDGLLEGNRRMLEELRGDVDRARAPDVRVPGPGARASHRPLDHTLIRGPAIIGPRARLSHAYVGPYTSIGADVRIEGSQIEHSIVLDGAELLHVGTRLTPASSAGARGSPAVRRSPSAMRLSVGDGAEISFS